MQGPRRQALGFSSWARLSFSHTEHQNVTREGERAGGTRAKHFLVLAWKVHAQGLRFARPKVRCSLFLITHEAALCAVLRGARQAGTWQGAHCIQTQSHWLHRPPGGHGGWGGLAGGSMGKSAVLASRPVPREQRASKRPSTVEGRRSTDPARRLSGWSRTPRPHPRNSGEQQPPDAPAGGRSGGSLPISWFLPHIHWLRAHCLLLEVRRGGDPSPGCGHAADARWGTQAPHRGALQTLAAENPGTTAELSTFSQCLLSPSKPPASHAQSQPMSLLREVCLAWHSCQVVPAMSFQPDRGAKAGQSKSSGAQKGGAMPGWGEGSTSDSCYLSQKSHRGRGNRAPTSLGQLDARNLTDGLFGILRTLVVAVTGH